MTKQNNNERKYEHAHKKVRDDMVKKLARGHRGPFACCLFLFFVFLKKTEHFDLQVAPEEHHH